MKSKWRNYALKDGKVKESYIREYSCRSPKRQAREASGRYSLLKSEQEQTQQDTKVEHESSRKENFAEAYQEGRQRVQESDKRRCEIEKRTNTLQASQEEKVKQLYIEPEITNQKRTEGAKDSNLQRKRRVKRESSKSS